MILVVFLVDLVDRKIKLETNGDPLMDQPHVGTKSVLAQSMC